MDVIKVTCVSDVFVNFIPQYMEDLIALKDKQLIKVITGIRRCGKSTLFALYQDYLLNMGISQEQIITLNLEDGDCSEIVTYQDLYTIVKNKLLPDKMNYIFLDEVQRVEEFQRAVDSLFIKKNCDVYVTGSNAFLLS